MFPKEDLRNCFFTGFNIISLANPTQPGQKYSKSTLVEKIPFSEEAITTISANIKK